MSTKKEKILIIIAHRNTDKSFNHRMAQEAEKLLLGKGNEVKIVDLHKIKFNPLTGPNDFKTLKNPSFFDYQAEQKYSNIDTKGENFVDEIKEQQKNIQWATTIIYQFPFEWLDIPAILKGFVERVYSYYFAYGGGYSLSGKKWMASVTTGGPEGMFQKPSVKDYLNSFYASHSFMSVQTIPLYVAYAVDGAGEDKRIKMIESFKSHLMKYL